MNKRNHLVSVIIPNYNYAIYLDQCIKSVLKQTYKKFEIIVVDDGSTDNSLQVLNSYLDKVTLVLSKNYGSSAARNLGVLYAKGDYITFLDADDFWAEDFLMKQIKTLEENKADLVYCGMRIFSKDSDEHDSLVKTQITHDWFLQNPGSTPFSPSSVLLTKKLAALVGAWNTSLKGPSEDFDYFRKCAKFGAIAYLNEFLVHHRQHDASMTGSGVDRYFSDNLKCLRIMLTEDREYLRMNQRLFLWFKFHYKFVKTAIKTKNLILLIKLSKGLLSLPL